MIQFVETESKFKYLGRKSLSLGRLGFQNLNSLKGKSQQSFLGHGLGKNLVKGLEFLPNLNLSLVRGEGSAQTIARLSASI